MASILVNSIYAMVNYPVVMINTLLAPLSILAVVTFASHGSLLPIGALGALIMNMVQSGISIQGDLSHLKNDMKLQDMVVSSPTSAGIYIFGMAISEIVYSIPTLTLLLILNFLFVKASLFAWFLIFIDMATIFTFSIALGFLLSTFSSDIVQSWAFAGILSPLLSTIPPVYYPITFIPLPYRYISYLSPTTYAAEIAQSLAGYVPVNIYEFIMLWIVLIGITVLIFFLALKKSRWREV
ncbi:MAG: ABC transporter permease [Euryarchaeota archaeon]|jgi:ABC-2 type transport system permease protein|nr:ABC transporter permease [Euryarchaeota archaeon]MVT14488.1 ABC transporter permease [Euryarchaeota archaeon]MVT36323.1 ABC transporter permease [Euryarchaeota archaeon]